MSIKYYGIYLNWHSDIDLSKEGLGRYLASFLRGLPDREDIRFVIACPNGEPIINLCQAENISINKFELRCLSNQELSWSAFYLQKFQKKCKKDPIKQSALSLFISRKLYKITKSIHKRKHRWKEKMLALPNRKNTSFISHKLYKLTKSINKRKTRWKEKIVALHNPKNISKRPSKIDLSSPITDPETARMIEIINTMTHVKAWYCPMAFWPSFNEIKAPRLMCVPDIVLNDFPIEFAVNNFNEQQFLNVEQSIRGGNHFVTYSEHVKQHTLVQRYGISANQVSVVHHAPNCLSQWVTFSGPNEQENQVGSLRYCHTLFEQALSKASYSEYTRYFANNSIKFLFYASQIRPTKNVLTLLRAYNYLLRKCYVTHKLILTGHPNTVQLVNEYIVQHGLTKDVLFLHGLSVSELAACYKLADLAITPSLSEGGFPFTFSEALSVGTPVLMASIPVTKEIITDSALQEIMLFNPYCWKNLATRIEWAIKNQDTLLEAQQPLWKKLSKRQWRHVVDEIVNLLDKVAETEQKAKVLVDEIIY